MVKKLLDLISKHRQSHDTIIVYINVGSETFNELKSASHCMYFGQDGDYFEGIRLVKVNAPNHMSLNLLQTVF